MKRVFILMILTIFIISLTSCTDDNIMNSSQLVESTLNNRNVEYFELSAYWRVYKDTNGLMEFANLVFIGKITGISFEVLDMGTLQAPKGESDDESPMLNTMYDIDVITLYKGDLVETVRLRAEGGRCDDFVEEQIKELDKYDQKGIYILDDMPEINIGETYLFTLFKADDYHAASLVNPGQSFTSLTDPLSKDQYGYISAIDIISYFGKDKLEEFETKKDIWLQ